jgi:predicted DNA-binding protein (MmcQ/YjbR family)
MATLAKIKKHCASLPGATSDIKWGQDLCYSVGGKMFAVMCETGEHANTLSFKVEDERFLELTDRQGFIPAPYLARAKWVYVKDVRKVPEGELKPLITRSYELIAAKLPKSVRAKLGA